MINNLFKATKKILIINASSNREGHTYQLLKAAIDTLSGIEGVSVTYSSLADIFESAIHTSHRFDKLADQWEGADGIILGSPVYTFGPPSYVFEFFDLLQSRYQDQKKMSIKPVGIVAQGGGSYSGAEVTAQVLMNLSLSVGCTPISGDMPGNSQGFIGQITDNSNVGADMLDSISRLSIRVLEMVNILSAAKNGQNPPLHILGVVAGSNVKDECIVLMKSVLSKLEELYPQPLDTEIFDFNGKNIEPCHGCTQYCSSDLECIYHDDMQEFRNRWLLADAVMWAYSSSGFGIEPGLVAAIDRMNQVRFETYFGSKQPHMPRYLKITAFLGVGNRIDFLTPTTQFLHHAGALYQNILLPQSRHGGSYLYNPNKGERSIADLDKFATLCNNFLEKTAEVVSGLEELKHDLPGEYYPSRQNYARLDHEVR